jgi:hypothetical protein
MKGMNGGCLAFSHRQRQSLSYIIIDSSSFPSFLSLSLPDTSKMAQNGRTPSILLSQTHFLYAFLFLWYPFTIFFFSFVFPILWVSDSLSDFLASAVDAAKKAGEVR